MASLPGPTPSRKVSVRAVKRSMREMPTSGSDLYDRDCSPGGREGVGQQGHKVEMLSRCQQGRRGAPCRTGPALCCLSTLRGGLKSCYGSLKHGCMGGWG